MKNEAGVLTGERRRSVVWGGLAIFIASALLFVGLRLWETFEIQAEVAALKGHLEAHEKAHRESVDTMKARVDGIEQYVFGTVSVELPKLTERPQAKAIPTTGKWQANRDAELRARIEALEKWRLSQRGQQQ